MSNLLAARTLMAVSLGFHIIFAIVGMAMPLLMVIAEWRWIRTGQEVYVTLAKRWAKGTAIFFAVGAVSGTALSFQLGLLWPAFMEWAGPIIGLAFSIEGFAFFTEAIFLGIYLYGWGKIGPKAHLAAGGIVALSGVASGLFVVMANGWMNTPTGFTLVNGVPADIDPIAALLNPAGLYQAPHMILAAYAATGFAVAGIHAYCLLRNPSHPFHQAAFKIAFGVAVVGAFLQPLSGDLLAKQLSEYQPLKLAVLEGQVETQQGAPFRLGGIWNSQTEQFDFVLEIPKGLSLLLHMDPDATVVGMKEFPRELWPPIAIVRTSFQIMILIGGVMVILAIWGAWLTFKTGTYVHSRGFLKTMVLATPLGFIATEFGWVSTEVGRQPWIIAGVLKTAQAVTPMPGLVVPLILFICLYAFLAAIVVWLMKRHVSATDQQYDMMPPSRETKPV
jgi:cytochrome bd ubiquinol oxidase subunit I